MDTLTHIVVGGCIGGALGGRQLGKKAILLGAVAQSLPDIDFVASFWLPTTSDLLAHRGITHSFLFVILATPLFAWLSSRTFRMAGMTLRQWLLFWGVQIFIHVFIDAFNAYGTGWFEPFSHYRVSFNTLYVADPLFSLWPGLSFIALLILKRENQMSKKWIWFGLGMSSLYLITSVCFKLYVESKVENDIKTQHITASEHFTTPTPFNNVLWFVVAKTDSGYCMGYRSVFDRKPVDFHFAARQDSLAMYAKKNDDVEKLTQFAQGYYTLDRWHDTVVFSVLRFGEMLGWQQSHPRPAFYYYLQYPNENKLIVQRGRFAGWNRGTLNDYLRRLAGN